MVSERAACYKQDMRASGIETPSAARPSGAAPARV